MGKCRICLNNRKRMHSLFDRTNEELFITYAEIMTSMFYVKVSKNDILPKEACFACCKRLKDVYEFKCLVERSDIELQKTCRIKRLTFANIQEIKGSMQIKESNSAVLQRGDISENFVNTCEKSLKYNNTVIQRLTCQDSTDKESVKTFLESFKEDLDYEYDIAYDVAVDYEPEFDVDVDEDNNVVNECDNNSDEDYIPVNKPKSKKKSTKPGSGDLMYIQPVYLPDIRVAKTKLPVKKKNGSKQTHKADMCPRCGKMVSSLKSHMLIHTGERNFRCGKCSKSFFLYTVLKAHERTHGSKDYKCDKCVAAFSTSNSLKKHHLIHSGQSGPPEKKFRCETCEKAFSCRHHLLRHIRGVHTGEKKFTCDQCPMTFVTKTQLNHHLRVHTGERPYKCEICSQPYSYRRDFVRHCLKKHGLFLKGRNVKIMNEETLFKERNMIKDMVLRLNGVIKDDKHINPFEGPHATNAFKLALEALEAKQISIDI